jgi:hypothetical protein
VTVKKRRLTGPLPLFQQACRDVSVMGQEG